LQAKQLKAYTLNIDKNLKNTKALVAYQTGGEMNDEYRD
jgi:hypothetical protein